MSLQKFTGPEDSEASGFVIVDLDGAEHADGIVRCARKILADGARTMARSRTYSWALLEREVSGASAGINAQGEARSAGIEAFVDAVTADVESGRLSFDAGKGVGASELSGLEAADTRSALRLSPSTFGTLGDELAALGAVVAAGTALGDPGGRTVAIEGAGALGPALVTAATAAGMSVVAVSTSKGTVSDAEGFDPEALIEAWVSAGEDLPAALSESGESGDAATVLGVPASVLFCGSKIGLIDHTVAEQMEFDVIAPIGVAPVTAKGLAVAGRAGVVVLADFLTMCGPLLAFRPTGDPSADELRTLATETVRELTAATLGHERGAYLGACQRAEAFLATWCDELPFGRPLA